MSKRTGKSNDIGTWIFLGVILYAVNPWLFALVVIGVIAYKYNKNNPGSFKINKLNRTVKTNKVINKDYVRQKDKAHNYEVIDASAEVISTTVIDDNEWKATKEYR